MKTEEALEVVTQLTDTNLKLKAQIKCCVELIERNTNVIELIAKSTEVEESLNDEHITA
jgi:hypothetical protein